jgi:2'-5' RNA ligase
MRKAAFLKTLSTFSPIHWQMNDFSLVRSITESHGVYYQVIDRWQLN